MKIKQLPVELLNELGKIRGLFLGPGLIERWCINQFKALKNLDYFKINLEGPPIYPSTQNNSVFADINLINRFISNNTDILKDAFCHTKIIKTDLRQDGIISLAETKQIFPSLKELELSFDLGILDLDLIMKIFPNLEILKILGRFKLRSGEIIEQIINPIIRSNELRRGELRELHIEIAETFYTYEDFEYTCRYKQFNPIIKLYINRREIKFL